MKDFFEFWDLLDALCEAAFFGLMRRLRLM